MSSHIAPLIDSHLKAKYEVFSLTCRTESNSHKSVTSSDLHKIRASSAQASFFNSRPFSNGAKQPSPEASHNESPKKRSEAESSSLEGTLENSSLTPQSQSQNSTERTYLESPSTSLESSPITAEGKNFTLEDEKSEDCEHPKRDSSKSKGETISKVSSSNSIQDQIPDVSTPRNSSPRVSESPKVEEDTQPRSCFENSGSFVRGWEREVSLSPVQNERKDISDSHVQDTEYARSDTGSTGSSSDDLSSQLIKPKIDLVPAKTATREDLAHIRNNSQVSSKDSTLAGTITDSEISESLESWEENENHGSNLKRPSPRHELQKAASRAFSSEPGNLPGSVPELQKPEDTNLEPEMGLQSASSLRTSLNGSSDKGHILEFGSERDSPLSVGNQPQVNIEFSAEFDVDGEDKSNKGKANFIQHDNELLKKVTSNSIEDLVRDETSDDLTSITNAIEDSQERLAQDQDLLSEAISQETQNLHSSSMPKLSDPQLSGEESTEIDAEKELKEPTLQEKMKRALSSPMTAPLENAVSETKDIKGKDSLEQARLCELESLLSSCSQLPPAQSSHIDQDLESLDMQNEWEFIENSLSAQMQSIKEASNTPGSNKKSYAITSQASECSEDLSEGVISHQITNWQSDSCTDSNPVTPEKPGP